MSTPRLTPALPAAPMPGVRWNARRNRFTGLRRWRLRYSALLAGSAVWGLFALSVHLLRQVTR